MKFSAVALGTFDGFHRGHQYFLEKLIKLARSRNLKSCVVVLSNPVKPVPGVLTTTREKLSLISGFPVDEIDVLDAGREIVSQPAKFFFSGFLYREIGMRAIVAGIDFAFGNKKKGNIAWLKRNAPLQGVAYEIVSPLMECGEMISSSRIRELLSLGDFVMAARFLGRMYSIEGLPVPGRGIGKKLGYPTVNLDVSGGKILPPGVHLCWVEGKRGIYPALANIGKRPTFFNRGRTVIEAYLFDFTGKWPELPTKVYLYRKIRDEKAFPDAQNLKKQIDKDVAEARAQLGMFFSGRRSPDEGRSE